MLRVVFLFLILPWWLYFFLAGGVGYLAEGAYQKELEREADKAAAFAAPMPELIDLSDFSRSNDVAAVDEVNVAGWINSEYNYRLVETTNGVETSERFMHVLFGSDDTESSTVARAAIILTEAQKDQFHEQSDTYMDASRTLALMSGENSHFIYALNGFASNMNGHSSQAYEVMTDEGLTRSDDFIFMMPFLDGREAAMMPAGVPQSTRINGWLFAAAIAMFGVAKFFLRRRKSKAVPAKNDPYSDGPIKGVKTAKPVIPQAAPMATNIAANSPLGRLAQQNTAEATPDAMQTAQDAFAAELAISRRGKIGKNAKSWMSPKLIGPGIAVLVVLRILFPGLLSMMWPILMILGFWGIFYLVKRGAKSVVSDLKGGKSKPATGNPFDRLYQETHPAE